MSQPIVINIGALPNDGTGDPLRTAFNDVNLNFANVFASGPVGSNIQIANNIVSTLNTNGNLVLSPNGIGIVQANSHVVPNQTRIRNLGSANLLWNTTYTQYLNTTYATIGTANIGNIGNLTIPVGNLHILGGTNGYVLQTDGTGNLTWTAQTGGSGNAVPAGANTQIQYNDAGNLGATAGFTFDNVTNTLQVPGVSTSSVFNFNGVVLENADLTHGATAAVVVPSNGDSVVPVQLNNTYGNIAIQAGIDSDLTATWSFNNDGSLSLPGGGTITSALGSPEQGLWLGFNGHRLLLNNDGQFWTGGIELGGNALPGYVGSYSNITLDTNIGNSPGDSKWVFDTTGNLTLPYGTVVQPGFPGVGNGPNIVSIVQDGQSWLTNTAGNTYVGYDTSTGAAIAANGNEWTFSNSGVLTTPGTSGNITGANVISAVTYTAPGDVQLVANGVGNVNVTTDTGTWRFNTNGNLDALDFLTIDSGYNSGYAGLVAVSGVNLRNTMLYNSGNVATQILLNRPGTPNPGDHFAQIALYEDNANAPLTWTFDYTGNLTLPGNTFAVNYANGTQVSLGSGTANTGNITFSDTTISTVNTLSNVVIETYDTANTTTRFWTFGDDGELYLPSGGRLGFAGKGWTGLDGGNGNPTSFTSFYANGNYAGCLTAYPDGNIDITTYGDGTGSQGYWQFDNTGTLNVGGNITSNNFGNTMYITGATANTDRIAGALVLSGGSTTNGIGGLPSAGGALVLNGGTATGCATVGGSVLINAGQGDGDWGNITLTVNSKATVFNESGQVILPAVKIGTENTYDPGNPYEGEQLGLYGTRRIISPNSGNTNQVTISTIIQSPQFGSPQVVYTAYNAKVWAFRMTMRIQHGAGTPQNMQMADIFAARNDSGDITYSITNRLKTDPTEDDVVIVPAYDPIYGTMFINATATGNGTASNGSYYFTFDVAEFNQTYD